MSRPIPSTRGVYKPGIGITITRANIQDEITRLIYDAEQRGRKFVPPTPAEIVMSFVTDYERKSKEFPQSKRFNRLVYRADRIMQNPKTVK